MPMSDVATSAKPARCFEHPKSTILQLHNCVRILTKRARRGKATDGAAACPQPGGAGRVPTELHGDSNAVQS